MAHSQAPLVVHVIYRLDYGGLENGLVNLINQLPAQLCRHAIVCLAGFTEFRRRIQRDDVEVYSLDKRPGKDVRAYVRFWRLLRQLRPAIVHTRNLGTVDMQWLALAAGVRRRVHGEHGWEAGDLQGRNRKSLLIRRLCRPLIHRYVAMSRDIAAWLQSAVGVEPPHITQLYNGVDVSRFQPEGALPVDVPWQAVKPLVFGTIGRLDPVKSQGTLLEAFAQLVAQAPGRRQELRLVIVGGGALAGRLQARAAELQIADLLWMPGARDDVADLLRAIDVFVLPSLNEGISNTILEAMATARPVIAARVGGNPELVMHGETGVLYDPGNVSALCAAMMEYRNDPVRKVHHGAAGRARVLNCFSLEAMVKNYADLYQHLLAA